MTDNNQINDDMLDRLTTEIRDKQLSPEQIDAAARRVWSQLEAEANPLQAHSHESATSPATAPPLRGCSDYQALFPALLAGELSASQALLVEDHSRECVPCRKALMMARAGGNVPSATSVRRRGFLMTRYTSLVAAIVAAVMITVVGWSYLPGSGGSLSVRSIDGELYSVSHPERGALEAGALLAPGEVVRTGRASSAFLEISDGSMIEMSARAQVSLTSKRTSKTIHLDRGHVIVEAAKQRRGKLYVATDDCLVSVTGTVFSVNTGTKGSRVSVIEGEVQVDYSGDEALLHPGDQVNTKQSLLEVPIEEEIAWSKQLDKHLALLEELVALQHELKARIRTPELRHESNLLALAAPDTMVYFAMPNIAPIVVDAHHILNERIGQSPVLNAWWQEVALPEGLAHQIDDAVQTIARLGATLGPEFVLTVAPFVEDTNQGGPPRLLLMASLEDPAAFRKLIDQQLERLEETTPEMLGLHLIDDPDQARPVANKHPEFYGWIDGELFAISPSPAELSALKTRRRGAAPGLVDTPFHADLMRAYRDGVAWIVGADLERILSFARANSPINSEARTLEALGLTDLERLIAEHKAGPQGIVDRAQISFRRPRRAVAGLLAEPAPMGALDFVSPEASAVFAVALKEPTILVDEWISILDRISPEFAEHRKQRDLDQGETMARQFAARLGGEAVFALDGPLLPKPAWKAVLEVYDPAGLQQDLEWMVEQVNRELDAHETSAKQLRLTSAPFGSRTVYTLHLPALWLSEIDYVFEGGYLIAAPSRALLERALRFHDAGTHLTESPRFRATLPSDGHVDFSAMLYQDISSKLGPTITGLASTAASNLTNNQQAAIDRLANSASASLLYAYAGEKQLTVGYSAPEGAVDIESLLHLSSVFGIQGMLEQPSPPSAAGGSQGE